MTISMRVGSLFLLFDLSGVAILNSTSPFSLPSQILEQCTYRLGLTQAARRLYTADGFMVLRLEDLVSWVQENYVTQAKAQLRAQRRGRRADNKHNKSRCFSCGTWRRCYLYVNRR